LAEAEAIISVTADARALPSSPIEYAPRISVRWRYLLLGISTLLALALVKVVLSPNPTLTLTQFAIEVGSLFVAEVGVALIVAFFVAYLVESRIKVQEARQRERERSEENVRKLQDAEAAERRRQVLARDVVEGVYGIQHKPSYVKAVIERNLQSMIVRDMIDLEYTLSELTDEQIEILHVPDARRFVMLTMLTTYTFRNLSSYEKQTDVRYSLPVRGGEGARALTQVEWAKIGEDVLSRSDIDNALESADEENDKTYAWPRSIGGNGQLYVSIRATALKERSDNEVSGFFYPSIDGARLRFTALPGMKFGLRPLTNSDITPERQEANLATWDGRGPVLPNDSVVFWWRIPADDARETENQDNSNSKEQGGQNDR